ncbi:polymorphic toxin type 15 domain-containing protein [Tritonibacter scottomollicae]|uniref:polymorphic toxin type 15 domain-containing protein n=1 Tax=Tritonibacter scottomollicae TaxID=483013 RepID=UPI003BACF62B
MAETAQEKFLREKQEYEDALAAYRNVLGRAAGTVQIPYAMQSSYAVENQGYERAATDPWISDRFPELKAAAERVQAEEQEFLALDDPFPSHANNQCSISSYTAQKVYEYYAALEMIYKLSTDAEFRREICGQLHQAYRNSALANQTAADLLRWRAGHLDDAIEEAERKERGDNSIFDSIAQVFGYSDGDALALDLMGYDSEDEFWEQQAEKGIVQDTRTAAQLRAAQDEMRRQAEVHQNTAIEQVKAYFAEMWEQVKARYKECGLFYAVVTVGVDGIFLAGEVLAGVALLRGLKFARKLLPNGRVRVEVTDVEGRTLGETTWSTDALEAKYGTPQENHIGGYAPDTNRDIPDSPAEKVLEQQPRNRESENNDKDEPERPNHPRGPRREVDCFDVPRNVDPAEFDRQLREQQDTINNMTADEMGYAHAVLDHAREVWRDTGQKGSFTKLLRGNGEAQRQARTKHREYLDKALGLDEDEIDELMADLDATHFLDIIAGGDPEHVGMGGAQENQRIGPAWTYKNTPSGASRAGQLKDYADQLRAAGRSDHLMNVGLSSCD